MSELEKFVNTVQSLSASGDYNELYGKLGKLMEILLKHASNLDTVLETLSIPQHTLGVMAVLLVKLTTATVENPADGHCLLAQVQDFILHCNQEQVQLAANIFTEMCHSAKGIVMQLNCPLKGIEILRSAINCIQTSNSQLTSAHADLIQLCLQAKCFKPALEFLDVDIMSISQENSQADSRYFLLYFYYGGLVYASLKNYERALYFLEVVVTTPAMAVSHIMLEAYKKYILVSLILHGKVVDVPKYTCLVVARFIKPLSLPYLKLSTAYATSSCEEVSKVLTKNQETFVRDGNAGLAKQVLASLRKKNIQRLTKTFLTLSLADVASRVQLASPRDAEQAILNMIEDGEIFASINQKDGMVVFHDDPEKYNSPAALRRLEDEMAKCVELDQRVQQMDEEMMVNPQFIKKQQCSSTDDDLTAITPGLATGGGGPSNSTI